MTAADTVVDLQVQVKRCPTCGTGFGREAAFCPFDGIALESGTWDPTRDPLTNAIIDNRYEVVEPLGEGGMGTVYKVRHTTLDRLFAMKVLRRDLAADAGLAARFLQEARATAAIRHPSVVAINDFGSLDDGAPYFVMELLVGETLATRIRARGILAPREAARIAVKLADALSAAHAANVVHRDLKPENVFLVGAATGKSAIDELRIVDFGAAKIVGASKLTRPGVVFGTPYYMSPEQASGQPVDARADVYSLGVLLYEMITGAVPFEADTYMGVLTKHMFAEPPKPSEKMPSGVQLGDLEAVILRALEKEPSERYASMAALSQAISDAAEGTPSSRPREAPTTYHAISFPALSTADRIQRSVSRQLAEERRRKRKSIVLVVVSAAATIVMCALAVGLIRDVDPPSSRTKTPHVPVTVPSSATPPVVPPSAIVVPLPATATIETSDSVPSASVAVTSPSPSGPRPKPFVPPAAPVTPVTAARPTPPAEPATTPAPTRTTRPDELGDPWVKPK